MGPCALLRPVHRWVSSSVLKNVNTYPPNPTFLKRLFLTDFKKYTHTPPPKEQYLGALDGKFRKPGGNAKTHRFGIF